MDYSNGNSFSIELPQVIKPPVSVLERSVAGGILMSFPPQR